MLLDMCNEISFSFSAEILVRDLILQVLVDYQYTSDSLQNHDRELSQKLEKIMM